MIQQKELLLCLTFMFSSAMFCNFYPMDSKACISKTDGIQCYFNQFENACLSTEETSHGCVNTLNRLSCMNQLTSIDGTEATCIFTNRCLQARNQHFKNLGCAENYSKYSCLNAQNIDCIWNDKCEQYKDQIPIGNECQNVFGGRSVTPSLCQKIQDIRCMSNGFKSEYKCVQVTEQMLMSIQCSQIGLNEQACVEILTQDQACIFEKNQCKAVINASSCNLKLNRLGCLSIQNPTLNCQWKNKICVEMTEMNLKCDQIYDVNPSVCKNFQGICQYDEINKKCMIPTSTELLQLKCNTSGLTKQACLSIKNQYCTFFRGLCEELSSLDLQQFQCKMELNEDACINITTQFQYCQWNGQQCTRIYVNQNTDCPINALDKISKYNGNVCQSIQKTNLKCKYNGETHLCEESTQLDACNTPYLNLQGCVSIIQIGSACQWTNQGCVNVKVVNNKTTCDSLKYANPIACSQVFESNSLGCYFNSTLRQCKSIKIKNSTQEEKDFLLNTDCSSSESGLNKVLCASITKPGQVCRWSQNQCIQVKSKDQISQVSCISLQYVNQQACALVEYMKEPCRYSQQELGCVNSIINGMQCEEAGLNTYACAIANKNCYFDSDAKQCMRLKDTSKSLLSSLKCEENSPTQGLCQTITTYGQLCTWSYKANKCQKKDVLYNSECLDFAGKNVIVNVNVCASIENEFPQQANKAICKFNSKKGVCEKNSTICIKPCCTTPCCTEDDKIGINAHSCSINSNQTSYCYFSHNLRCSQLTTKQIGILNVDTASSYFNANKYKCSQMTTQFCSRINWSTKQRCYNNGNLCINVNFGNYKNFDRFLLKDAINEYACLAIEAIETEDNNKKYFEYNSLQRQCNLISPSQSDKCQINGNRNICLRFTENKYCKWNQVTLKCEDMPDDEFNSISGCNSNQNIKACIENSNIACQFFLKSDSCMDTYPNENCEFYNGSSGKVSKRVCTQITKDGQMCKFEGYKCIKFEDSISSGCELDGINSLACYKLTTQNCRWDVSSQTCYEDKSNIDDLECEDNLNKVLCLQVTKQPCVWNDLKFKCLKLTNTSSNQITSVNSYNELACHIISGAFEYSVSKCNQIEAKNNDCTKQSMNKYACLFNTQGHRCYYDSNETVLNKRCKQFQGEQTQCTSTILINIQVCMEIPKQCFFDQIKQVCSQVEIDYSVLCSDLQNNNTRNYNYQSCASISEDLTQTYGDNQCYQSSDKVQTCNYEKYCFWDSSTYNCSIKQLHSLQWVPKPSGCSSDDSSCVDKCSGTSPLYVNECSYRYSKALCLEMNKKDCFFDINLGGCNQIEGNEMYISDCINLYQYSESETVNNCNRSMNLNAICKPDQSSQESPQGCQSFKRDIFKCVYSYDSNETTCDTSNTSPSPSLCSIASTNCRFDKDNKKCTIIKSCDCDQSFSKSLCESCDCDYDSLGYCQKKDTKITAPQINEVPITIEITSETELKSNKYYLCNQVNLLNSSYKSKICCHVEQSCMYTDSCTDVTGYSCKNLMDNLVSSKACIQCKGEKMYYDQDNYCKILTSSIQPNLNQLNEASCVSSHFEKALYWDGQSCKEYQQTTPLQDCSSYNVKACVQIEQCWIHSETKLCSVFNENIGNCKQQYTQNYCLLSNKEMCYWDSDKNECIQAKDKEDYDCIKANKFGCLNMLNKLCVWSNVSKCQSIKQSDLQVNTCSDFLVNKFDFYNASICTLLKIPEAVTYKSCFRDSNYQCRSPTIVENVQCDTPGLNQYGCIYQTQGNCKFSNSICTFENSRTLECESENILLNINACLQQNKTCKFEEGKCRTYEVQQLSHIQIQNVIYSVSVCSSLDETISTPSFIYNSKTKGCIDIENRTPYLNSCDILGINKKACLQKTNTYCKYNQNQCQKVDLIELDAIQFCNDSYNQMTCLSIKALCKFQDGRCQNLDKTENCESLINNKSVVKAQICSKQEDKVCLHDSNTNQCYTTTAIDLLCSMEGLNKQGCLFNTAGQFCKFQEDVCQDYFEDANCTDLINQDKCYSIKRGGQYCYFQSDQGCQDIKDPIQKCGEFDVQTNPVVCSQATDKPCYYDIETKKCKQYDSGNAKNTVWDDNYISFNQQACEQYNIDNKIVIWDNGCQEIKSSNLSRLLCIDSINKLSCQRITTPNQNCQYVNNKCQNQILDQPVGNCETIENINTGLLCEKALDKACRFDKEKYKCVAQEAGKVVNCSDITNGYNKLACDLNTDCKFNEDYHCYQKIDQVIHLCQDATSITECQNVQDQGCYFDVSCKKIIDYSIIECKDVVNVYGCQRITKTGIYCKYIEKECKVQNPLSDKDTKCKDIGIVNSPVFCEQVIDDECKYDINSKNCELDTSVLKQYYCDRGLNVYTCLNRTRESLQCKFENYCYGPNDLILNCQEDETNLNCCSKAQSKDSCLFQSKFKCQWQDETCVKFEDNQTSCDQIQLASKSVCNSINNSICILDQESYKCKIIELISCNQAQNKEQCRSIKEIPCFWDQQIDQCTFKQKLESDECIDIKLQNGNIRACMDVQKEGQFCQFINNECETFQESENIKGCLDNINKVSCTNQVQSECIWNYKIIKIKKNSSSKESELSVGECQSFIDFDKVECNDLLSYLSCLKITTLGVQCQWNNSKCQQITINSGQIFTPRSFALINGNSCGLVNNGDQVRYNSYTNSCMIVTDINTLTCSPLVQGMNKQSCVRIKTQKCSWDDKLKLCRFQGKRLLQENGLLKRQHIDSCNVFGFNKLTCLQSKQHPCAWIIGQDNQYTCQEYYPSSQCTNVIQNVNPTVCSHVTHDACVYNPKSNSCETPSQKYTSCSIEGINALACSTIQGCIFSDQKCQKYNTESISFCHQLKQANYQVCSQAIDKCKYSEFHHSCIPSSNSDYCSTLGISSIGCNSISECQWLNSKCQCLAYIQKYPECQTIKDQTTCQNVQYCFYQINDVQFGICRDKQCSDLDSNECEGYQFKNRICYLNKQSECLEAKKCVDLIQTSKSCSNYSFNKIKCKQNNYLNQCEDLNCIHLNKEECMIHSNECIFIDNCKKKSCEHMNKIQCLQNNCQWDELYQKCNEQVDCSQITSNQQCQISMYKGVQCTWINKPNQLEQCISSGCQQLNSEHCNGIHIGNSICVQMKDYSCVSCEDINDACTCLNQSKYCTFSYQTNLCSSKNCYSYNENDCPSIHCIYQQEICQPQCLYIYNQHDCNHTERCNWDEINQVCINTPEIVSSQLQLIQLIVIVLFFLN